MPVPETTMHKNDGFVFGQYNIGFAGEIFYVQAVTESVCKKKLTHQHLRFRILAFYAAHIVGAGFRVVDVGHAVKIRKSEVGRPKLEEKNYFCIQ